MMSKTGNDGFTLVEVVLAVAILSIGITSIFRAYIVCLDVMRASQEYTTALSLAKNKLADYQQQELREKGLRVQEQEGHFDDPFREYEWKAHITPSDQKDLNTVQMTVYNGASGSKKEINLYGYVKEKKDD
jgi:type II secretion system protein I